MVITRKQIIQIGAVAGALTAAGGLLAFASPIARNVLDSGPLPLPSRTELIQYQTDTNKVIQQLQQNNLVQQQQIQQTQRNLDISTLTLMMNQLIQMQFQAGPNPNLFARKSIQDLKDQINPVRNRLGLTPIQ
jgi:hypothetical protein